jgi:hypothetical protein
MSEANFSMHGDVNQVELHFEDGNFTAGPLEFEGGEVEGHGGMQRSYEHATVPIVPHVLGRPDLKGDPLVLLHTNPTRLREVCEDILAQLDIAEGRSSEPGEKKT